jgi:hypothetical protein
MVLAMNVELRALDAIRTPSSPNDRVPERNRYARREALPGVLGVAK